MNGKDLLFSRFRINRKIGAGGFSEVFEAFDVRMERKVAIKRIPKTPHTAPRAIREAKTVALLTHPNIVTVHDFIEDEQYFYLVMEQIKGVALDEVFRLHKFNWEESVALALQVSRALECAHSNNVIHRDIKPSNLILLDDGRIKVLDFGISRLMGSSPLTADSEIIGTLNYISPEQIEGEFIDEKTDLFSLGVVIYEALTGVNPFEAETHAAAIFKVMNSHPKPPHNEKSLVPLEISDIVMRLINKSPEKRYSSAVEMRYKLERYSGNINEQALLKNIAGKVDNDRQPDVQTGDNAFPDKILKYISRGAENPLPTALLVFLLILSAGRLSSDTLPLWAVVIGILGAAAAYKLPRTGLLTVLLILLAISSGYSFWLAFFFFPLLSAYFLLTKKQNSFLALIPFSAPVFASLGAGLLYPFILGMITTPARAFIPGLLGALILNLNDIFSNDTIRFLYIKSPHLFKESLAFNTIFSGLVTTFLEYRSIFLQAILFGITASAVSFFRQRIKMYAPVICAAMLILTLYVYRVFMMLDNLDAKSFQFLVREWGRSLLFSAPVLIFWFMLNKNKNKPADNIYNKEPEYELSE